MSDTVGTCKAAMVTLLEAAAPQKVEVVVGLDPEGSRVSQLAEFFDLILDGVGWTENQLIGSGYAQIGRFNWTVFIGLGPGKVREDIYTRLDTLFEAILDNVAGKKPTADGNTDAVILVDGPTFTEFRDNGGAIYRVELSHAWLGRS